MRVGRTGGGGGGGDTCTAEAEVHEQSHRVFQCVVRQAVGVLQKVDQPEDEAVSDHCRLQRAPKRKQPSLLVELTGKGLSMEERSMVQIGMKGSYEKQTLGSTLKPIQLGQ